MFMSYIIYQNKTVREKTCKYASPGSKQRLSGKVYAVIIIQCVNYKSQHAYI